MIPDQKSYFEIINQSCLQGEMGASARPIVEFCVGGTLGSVGQLVCTLRAPLTILQLLITFRSTSVGVPAANVGSWGCCSYFHRLKRETRQSILTFIAQRGSISETLCF